MVHISDIKHVSSVRLILLRYTYRTTGYRQTHGMVMLPCRSILGWQTDRQTGVTKHIISPASRSMIINNLVPDHGNTFIDYLTSVPAYPTSLLMMCYLH